MPQKVKNDRSEYYKRYREQNRHRIAAKNRKWSADNREKRNAYYAKWRAENREKIAQTHRKYQQNIPAALRMWRSARKKRANAKRRQFTLNVMDVQRAWPADNKCPVFGTPLVFSENKNASPSLDRFDSSRGYERDNICVVSWRANSLKKDATLEEMKKLVQWWEAEEKKRNT